MSESETQSPRARSPPVQVKSEPITIKTGGRRRGDSFSSSSSGSDCSEIATPIMNSSSQINRISIATAGTSPILSYFLGQPSPTNKTAVYPFKRNLNSNQVVEEEEIEKREAPATVHGRRASVSVADRFSQQPVQSFVPEPQQERASGLLRRLSLSSGAFVRPQNLGRPASPPAFTSNGMPVQSRHRRSATLNAPPRRAPSPMGERILKGHFDGFN